MKYFNYVFMCIKFEDYIWFKIVQCYLDYVFF